MYNRMYAQAQRNAMNNGNSALYALTNLPARVAGTNGFHGLGVVEDSEAEAKKMIKSLGITVVVAAIIGYMVTR